MAEKISVNNGILNVPDDVIIPFIEGDGIGADIMPPSLRVLDAALEKAYTGMKRISWLETANLIYAAIEKAVARGYVTSDLHLQMEGATLRTTDEFAQDLIDNL